MDQNDDFTQASIPSVFVEQAQAPPAPPPPRRSDGGRASWIVIALVLFGALVASTAGLLLLRDGEQEEWARVRQRLEGERGAAVDRAGRLDVENVRLRADLEAANAKVEKYDGVEYQLDLIRQKTQQILDLRTAKPSYPHNAYMDLDAVPDWSAPGVRLLKEFVARLDAERAKLIAFKEPTPPAQGPTTPQITPLPGRQR